MSGPPMLNEVLRVLREEQPAAERLGVRFVGVVGSVARGEAGPGSDVDVVFDVLGEPTYFDLGGLALVLEERLGCRVDFVSRRAMKPDRWAYMGRDLVAA